MRLECVWLVLASVALKCKGEQRFSEEPKNTTAIIGSRLELDCAVVERVGLVQWTKDDLGLGYDMNLSAFDRYKFNRLNRETFNLVIDPVLLDDEGLFQCQVSSGSPEEPGIRSRIAAVTILVPPHSPEILQGDSITAVAGDEIQLECVSAGGKPQAEITWVDHQGNIITENVEKTIEPTGKTFTVRSWLRFTVEKQHDGAMISCRSKNIAEPAYSSATVNLKVHHPPEARLEIEGSFRPLGWMLEGSSAAFNCVAKANPMELEWEWRTNGVLLPEKGSQLIIEYVDRELNDAFLECKVKNDVGEATASELLRVSYAPSFITNPKTVTAAVGSLVVLHCDADGNPPPRIKWMHENFGSIVGTTPELTLLIHKDSSGVYTCVASVPGYPEIKAEFGIIVEAKPVVSVSLKQKIEEGIGLRCNAWSVAPISSVSWSFLGKEINSDIQNYDILEKQSTNGIESTLLIKKAASKRYGIYNCSVENERGMGFALINLQPPDISGFKIKLTFGILLMITVLIVIMYFVLRRHAPTKVIFCR